MIPVNEPLLSDEAKANVLDCLNTGWISSAGKYITQFEQSFANYIGTTHAVTTTNGTTALHLALATLGVTEGDEVIIPDLTIISCVLAVLYTGAIPVVVDVNPQTGNMDPAKLEAKITKRTKVIMPVHLFGQPVEMDPILAIAKKYHLKVVEDAAEAHGALYQGKKVGGLGDIGCFSFYANKIVTTGEGGMIVLNDTNLFEKAQLLKNLAHSPKQRFLHEEIGYNFRMTNIQAAMGAGELQHIDEYIRKKRSMAKRYHELLQNIPQLVLPQESAGNVGVYWMYNILLSKNAKISKKQFREKLKDEGVDTRDYFYPIHSQPVCERLRLFKNEHCPVSEDLSDRGLYLPSGLAITDNQIISVADAVRRILQ